MKVLVVEDEPRIANAIKKGLEIEKMIVDVAYDGNTGYDLAESGNYDLIILDLMLPQKDGLSICQDLREISIHTPILILTAKGEVGDKVKGLNYGADDYLAKPFAFEELLARINALARRPKMTKSNTLVISDLIIDTNTYEVKRQGKIVNLSAKEYSLLEYLARNSNKILTKDEIINHVWDFDSDVLINTVEVYIANLRKKIDTPFGGTKLIKTIRGFGYKIG